MSFMQPEIARFTMLLIDNVHGETQYIPAVVASPNPTPADLAEYADGDLSDNAEITAVTAYWARFSAPGYLDCTDWHGPYDTKADATTGLADTYDVCTECWEQCWDSDEPCK
jgi:hypothetical protein